MNLTQSVYEPLTVSPGETVLVNDFAGSVEIRELSPLPIGTEVRLRLSGNNGTPPVYLGTEGSLTVIPANPPFPRAMPLDETAVLVFTSGIGPTGGDAWALSWE